MKTIVIGLGNPILGDDGVGWSVAENVRSRLTSSPAPLLKGVGNDVDVGCLALGGISLMEHLIGYERAILIDALISDKPCGSIIVTDLDGLPNHTAFHVTSVHDMSLQYAMRLGSDLGVQLPHDVIVVGIASNHVYDFSEELSPPIRQAIPKATQIVVDLLMQNITTH